VIKAILMLEKGTILPNASFLQINPKIDAKSLRIAVARDAMPWPSQGLRRISVQCFGFGGANTHVVIDDTKGYLQTINPHIDHPTSSLRGSAGGLVSLLSSVLKTSVQTEKAPNNERLLVWSTDDENGIGRTKDAWKKYLSSQSLQSQGFEKADRYLAKLAYTLSSRRSHLSWRAFSITSGVKSVTDIIDRMAGPFRASPSIKLTFVFTGQGSQWFAMGRELIDRYEVFRRSLEESSAYFSTLGCRWDVIGLSLCVLAGCHLLTTLFLLAELSKDTTRSNVNNALYSQPLCTGLQVALVELLKSFGIRPTTVVGHSSGEIAAA
jgi:acyl transferase domain-containing protein